MIKLLKFFLTPCVFLLVVSGEIECFALYYKDTDPVYAAPFSTLLVERQTKRADTSLMPRVYRALNIKKNMVILDIGTGSGQYAYKFAQQLNGTGMVFATDINPDMINYVKNETQRKHLKNLVPVLVKAKGVDGFYSQHRYDLIFMAHTLSYIQGPVDYFSQIKKYLNPQGHLAIMELKLWNEFKAKDFTDTRGLIKQILNERSSSPFYKYLKPLQPMAARELAHGITPEFLTRIARCFNAMANHGDFFVPFLDEKRMILKNDVRITPAERAFVNLDLSLFREYNVQDKNQGVDLNSPLLNKIGYKSMLRVNRILIISEFQPYMYGGKPPFFPGGGDSYQIKTIKNILTASGFKLERVYDFIPNNILMVFSPQG